MMEPITLLINAGGQSRRMGQSKALLPVPPHNLPLIAHIAARLLPLAPGGLVVVTNDPALPAQAQLPPATRFVPDAYPDTGTLGGIATKPAVVDGQIVPREMLSVTLSFDHDVVDGAPAARFVERLKKLAEGAAGLEEIA